MGCVNHRERDARFTCTSCGRSFCVECVTWSHGQLLCRDCERGAGPRTGAHPGAASACPAWESRQGLFDVDAIYATIREVLLRPTATFSGMRTDAGLGSPLAYAVLLGTIGALFSVLWEPVQLSLLPGIGELRSGGEHLPPSLLVATALLSPLVITAGVFLSSGLTHLSLSLLGWARAPFEGTFRVYCYAHGSLALFQAIPFCGGLIVLVWSPMLYVIGIAAVQRLSFPRAALAIALPFLACCACAGALLASLLGTMRGALSPVALLPGCPFHVLTGLPCPTCGGTRALLALARLEWREALVLNPLVASAAVLGGPLMLAFVMLARSTRRNPAELALGAFRTTGGRLILIATIAANWAYLISAGR